MPTKPSKNGRQNYNWNLIMNDYITDAGSSLGKISEKYGIRLATIKQKSKADNWFATKQEYQKEVRQRARQKLLPKKANELAGLVEASDYIEKAILKAFKDPEYFNKHIISENLSEQQATLDILNTKAMKDMMKVIKDVEDVKRSIMDIKRSDQKLAAERLQLERERFEFEKQKAEMFKPTEGNAIRIEGFEKEWAE
jgi:LysM repeat protein